MTHSTALASVQSGPSDAKYCVIWLHGLGANGHDFAGIVPELGRNDIHFVFPHAPEMAVTLNGGMVMPAWYDLYTLTGDAREDEAGIRATQTQIQALIETEIARGVASENIVLAGFSQGGAIALHTALRCPYRLAGVMALSTYLPLHTVIADEAHSANRSTPILFAHGDFDDVVQTDWGLRSHALLQSMNYPAEWHSYPMDHAVCPDEIATIKAFLNRVL